MRARRISSLGLRPQPAWGAGTAATERGAFVAAASGATAAGLLGGSSCFSTCCSSCSFLSRWESAAILEAVADEVTETGLGAPSRQVSIIVEDGRGLELLVLGPEPGIVLDPVAIGAEALPTAPTAAEEPLSAVAPDFLRGGSWRGFLLRISGIGKLEDSPFCPEQRLDRSA